MTQILTPLITEDIDNCKYVRLVSPFSLYSDTLNCKITIPAGFVYDYESVPVIRGSNKRGGTAHDYLCRIDSEPIVTKSQAAAVYLEVMNHCYSLEERNILDKVTDKLKAWIKYGVVYVAPCYFHKYKVLATYEEISGCKK